MLACTQTSHLMSSTEAFTLNYIPFAHPTHIHLFACDMKTSNIWTARPKAISGNNATRSQLYSVDIL